MNLLTINQIAHLQSSLKRELDVRQIVPAFIGGTVVCGGFWRFFSSDHPNGGIDHWNEQWCNAWALPQRNIFAFGEDVFGNQLILTNKELNVYVCDHENGSCHDLELGVADLLEAVLQHGLSWIDFYSNGSLEIAMKFIATLSWEQHLHWTQPLVLGGSATAQNVSIVDRFTHLTGHIKLWKQISGESPGTEIIFH